MVILNQSFWLWGKIATPGISLSVLWSWRILTLRECWTESNTLLFCTVDKSRLCASCDFFDHCTTGSVCNVHLLLDSARRKCPIYEIYPEYKKLWCGNKRIKSAEYMLYVHISGPHCRMWPSIVISSFVFRLELWILLEMHFFVLCHLKAEWWKVMAVIDRPFLHIEGQERMYR